MRKLFPTHEYLERLLLAVQTVLTTLGEGGMEKWPAKAVKTHPHLGRLARNIAALKELIHEYRRDAQPLYDEVCRQNATANNVTYVASTMDQCSVVGFTLGWDAHATDLIFPAADALREGIRAIEVGWLSESPAAPQPPIQVRGYFDTACALLSQPPVTVQHYDAKQCSSPGMLRVTEAETITGLSKGQISRLCSNGALKSTGTKRNRRIDRDSLDAYLLRNRRNLPGSESIANVEAQFRRNSPV